FDDAPWRTFRAIDPRATEAVKARLLQCRAAAEQALARRDFLALASFDPFASCREHDVWDSGAKPRATHVPIALAVALAAACASVAALIPIRARVGDDVAFEQAAGVDTPASYEHYLAVGSRHAGEVATDRLPRARLGTATSLAALRKVRDDYAGTSVGKQAEA